MSDIRAPETPDEYDAVRALCWEYRDYLLGLPPEAAAIVRVAYPEDAYAALLDRLDIDHVPPSGRLLLARKAGRPVGCGMSKGILPGATEIKRVYVRPEARGLGLGRAIMDRLISAGRSDGYARILMDTGSVMTEAQRLYDAMGFVRRGPYQPMPPEADGLMVFYEMTL